MVLSFLTRERKSLWLNLSLMVTEQEGDRDWAIFKSLKMRQGKMAITWNSTVDLLGDR